MIPDKPAAASQAERERRAREFARPIVEKWRHSSDDDRDRRSTFELCADVAAAFAASEVRAAIAREREARETPAIAPQSFTEWQLTEICRDVSELPDRNSPEDWPEAMLVTGE